jgi:bifunctional DNA-binding transcriptional regulator/antitoxin component of YhaV-PrlF toxin-antitoxin module
MSQVIEVSLDNRGHILIPAALRRQLGLLPGMTLVVEETANHDVRLRIRSEAREVPALVDKGGVLVVRVEPLCNLTDAIRQERDRRVSDLSQRKV